MMENNIEIIRTALGLLNSMVNSGVVHSMESDEVVRKARIALNEVNLTIPFVRRSSSVKDKNLNSEEYYNLMQGYRIADPLNQDLVIKKFEEVKEWTRQNYA